MNESMNENGFEHLDQNLVEALKNQQGKPEVDITSLEVKDKVIFKTQNSTYEIIIMNPEKGEVAIMGGSRFPFHLTVFINGSTFGGSTIKPGYICEGMRVEILRPYRPGEPLLTTEVKSIEVIKNDKDV